MTPTLWLLVFFAVGVTLFFAELFLPTHGVLGLLGALCVAAAIGTAFYLNLWLGIGVLAVCVFSAPFVFKAMVAAWQRTAIGREMVLNTVVGGTGYDAGGTPRPLALIGSVGLTVSEHRPMGESEFASERVQSQSEDGRMIPPGTPVKLIALKDTVAVVRPSN